MHTVHNSKGRQMAEFTDITKARHCLQVIGKRGWYIQVESERFNFATMQAKASAYGERRDCMVKAWAIAQRVPYETAHAMFKALGRKDRSGTRWAVTVEAMRGAGVCIQWLPRRVTVARIGHFLGAGRYIAVTTSHALAVINGVVEDWTAQASGRHQVVGFIKFA